METQEAPIRRVRLYIDLTCQECKSGLQWYWPDCDLDSKAMSDFLFKHNGHALKPILYEEDHTPG